MKRPGIHAAYTPCFLCTYFAMSELMPGLTSPTVSFTSVHSENTCMHTRRSPHLDCAMDMLCTSVQCSAGHRSLTWLVVFQAFSESMSPSRSLMTLLPLYFSALPGGQGRIGLSQHAAQSDCAASEQGERCSLDAWVQLVSGAHKVRELRRQISRCW